jgi:hypothetical protein
VSPGPLTLEGNAGLGPDDPRFDYGRLALRLPLRAREGARFEIAGLAGKRPPLEEAYSRLEGRLLLEKESRGAWLGVASRRDDHLGTSFPLLGVGAWFRVGEVTPSAGLEQTPDEVIHRDYSYSYADTALLVQESHEAIRRSTVHAGLGWTRGRLSLESRFGVSLSHAAGPRRWVRGRAAVALVSGFSLVGSAGTGAPDLFGSPENHSGQATLGLSLNPAWGGHGAPHGGDAPQWKVVTEGEGWYTIEVRASGAQLVEITSDATQWTPRALEHGGGDRWTLRLHLEPGIYHVNLRIDGGSWIVPPGAPTASDDFIGDTGVMVVGG